MIQQLLPQLLPLNARKNRRRTILYVGIAAGSVGVFYVLNEIALLALRATNLSTSLANYGLLRYGQIGLVMLALLAVLWCIDRVANRSGKVP